MLPEERIKMRKRLLAGLVALPLIGSAGQAAD
ncbi:MAG: hypothetical protein FD153_179 [Rhodospirillaceae bacterium]|nr:MAG: hypothetical protein FD153_179 [Rhodospirillaceae bacterium]